MTPRNKDLNSSVVVIKLQSHQDSPVRGFDAAPDSGLQIDLTVNLNKGSISKQKWLKPLATSKEKKQPAGKMKKFQAGTTNPNITSTENLGKPSVKLLDTEGKNLAIENPEALQNKSKVIKVGKSHQKRGQNSARDEIPIPYYFHYKKNNFFRQADVKDHTGYGKTAERGYDGQKSKLDDNFSPEAKKANLEAQSNALDSVSWGDSEYSFKDHRKKSTGKTPLSNNNVSDGMNSVNRSENRDRHSSPNPKLDLKGLTTKDKGGKREKKGSQRKRM
jgi:hypothetical protein